MKDPREGLNPDGTIRTGAGRRRVPPEFAPVLSAATRALQAVSGGAAELHLYGSVANGTAQPGISDVDLLAINVPPGWCQRTSVELTARFSHVCRGVDIGEGTSGDFLSGDDEAYGNRVFLRHYCLPLAGGNVLRPSGAFLGDARAARGFNGDIGIRLARWRSGSPTARSVARKTLFAAAGAMSVLNHTWTTDRRDAVRLWAGIEPARAPELAALVPWAEGEEEPATSELTEALSPGGIVRSVVEQFRSAVGLWP